MGFHEDDRIRSKNTVENAAYNRYSNLRLDGWSNQQIVEFFTNSCNLDIRDEIRLAVIRIARSFDEQT